MVILIQIISDNPSHKRQGDIVAIGAYLDEPSGGTNRGAVYVYQYNSATASWSLRGAH